MIILSDVCMLSARNILFSPLSKRPVSSPTDVVLRTIFSSIFRCSSSILDCIVCAAMGSIPSNAMKLSRPFIFADSSSMSSVSVVLREKENDPSSSSIFDFTIELIPRV